MIILWPSRFPSHFNFNETSIFLFPDHRHEVLARQKCDSTPLLCGNSGEIFSGYTNLASRVVRR